MSIPTPKQCYEPSTGYDECYTGMRALLGIAGGMSCEAAIGLMESQCQLAAFGLSEVGGEALETVCIPMAAYGSVFCGSLANKSDWQKPVAEWLCEHTTKVPPYNPCSVYKMQPDSATAMMMKVLGED